MRFHVNGVRLVNVTVRIHFDEKTRGRREENRASETGPNAANAAIKHCWLPQIVLTPCFTFRPFSLHLQPS